MLRSLGKYPVPLNFGWHWQDPSEISNAVGNEYSFWINFWVLSWNTVVSIYQLSTGIMTLLFIPVTILHAVELWGGETYFDTINETWVSFFDYA